MQSSCFSLESRSLRRTRERYVSKVAGGAGRAAACGTGGNGISCVMVSHLDHLVLTVADIPRAVRFYSEVLGMKAVPLGTGGTPCPSAPRWSNCMRLGGSWNHTPPEQHRDRRTCVSSPMSLWRDCFKASPLMASMSWKGRWLERRVRPDSFRLFSRPGWQPHRGVEFPERSREPDDEARCSMGCHLAVFAGCNVFRSGRGSQDQRRVFHLPGGDASPDGNGRNVSARQTAGEKQASWRNCPST